MPVASLLMQPSLAAPASVASPFPSVTVVGAIFTVVLSL